MKLSQLQEVVAIAEQGSIRAAARLLGLGQPTLTRSLAELERELGVTLFERQSRGVAATSLGQVFVTRALSILSEVRRSRDELEQLGGSGTGTVTAGLSIATHLALLPGALPPFFRRYPDTKLHVIEGGCIPPWSLASGTAASTSTWAWTPATRSPRNSGATS